MTNDELDSEIEEAHIARCCIEHGCKFGEIFNVDTMANDCPVVTGRKKQLCPCGGTVNCPQYHE